MSSDIRRYIQLIERPLTPPGERGTPEQFVAIVKQKVGAFFQKELADQEARQDTMVGSWGSRGSFPTGSFHVGVVDTKFHFDFPSSLATPDAIEQIVLIISQAKAETGLNLLIDQEVKGRSNYVIDGILH